MSNTKKVTFALALALVSTTVVCAEERRHDDGHPSEAREMSSANRSLPAYYPSAFQTTGILGRASSNGKIMINGKKFNISPNVLVHSLVTEHSSRFDLKEGEEAGFSYETTPSGTRIITEVWLLPKGSIRLR